MNKLVRNVSRMNWLNKKKNPNSNASNAVSYLPSTHSDKFQLPSTLPTWPPGSGFATGKICLGEIEVCQVSEFEKLGGCDGGKDNRGVSFYKPIKIPSGFHALGYYAQTKSTPLHGWVLVAKATGSTGELPTESNNARLLSEVPNSQLPSSSTELNSHHSGSSPALAKPQSYTLVWNNSTLSGFAGKCVYIWLPEPPDGYMSIGYVVTNSPQQPSLEEVRCVRTDLTDSSEPACLIWSIEMSFPNGIFNVWGARPCKRGRHGCGVPVGSFYCNGAVFLSSNPFPCLKNNNFTPKEMPNLDQIHALIDHYGPTIFFHPEEIYLPSSVSWFFENGALLYKKGVQNGEPVKSDGSNLPLGGSNDGEYWLDLPSNGRGEVLKRGNFQSAEVYVHVKPSLGGTFTDIVMWIFCPFNGPGTAKVGVLNLPLGRIGEHVCDWEHVTLRISNFSGELWSLYFSKHSGGEWVDASGLEFMAGNKAVVYSSKSGHANFPCAGTILQGDSRLGVGIRNDTARSRYSLDTSRKYKIVEADFLQMVGANGTVLQPPWLHYMREWGPTIIYNTRTELDRVLNLLPRPVRKTVDKLFHKLPNELSRQAGPTGPKMKDYWLGDERG